VPLTVRIGWTDGFALTLAISILTRGYRGMSHSCIDENKLNASMKAKVCGKEDAPVFFRRRACARAYGSGEVAVSLVLFWRRLISGRLWLRNAQTPGGMRKTYDGDVGYFEREVCHGYAAKWIFKPDVRGPRVAGVEFAVRSIACRCKRVDAA